MHGAKENVERFGQAAGGQGEKAAGKAKETASSVLGAVKETIEDVTGGAVDMANKAAGQVRDTASEWIGSAEDVAMNAAKTVQHAAGDVAGKAADWSAEVAGIIRRNPISAACIALGIGFLAAIASRRDSSS